MRPRPSLASSGSARFAVELVAGQSALTSVFATSPMKLLAPRPCGKSVWVYASTFGGGFVAGDRTRLRIGLGADCRCFVGTQATTRVYRNPGGRRCSHKTHARLGPRSLLVFTPDPVQAFAQSSFAQQQDFVLAPDASLVLLDWMTAGRVARGERWAFAHFSTRNVVRFQPDPPSLDRRLPAPAALIDAVRFDPADGPLEAVGRGHGINCLATLLLAGPLVKSAAAVLLEEVGRHPVKPGESLGYSASPWRDGAILRVAGRGIESVKELLVHYLQPLAALLGDSPWQRQSC